MGRLFFLLLLGDPVNLRVELHKLEAHIIDPLAAASASGDPPKNIEEEFARQLEGQGQETLDDIQDDYFSALEKHNSFEGALNALKTSHQQQGKQRRKLAGVIDELRHVSRNSGAQDTANKIGANNATHR